MKNLLTEEALRMQRLAGILKEEEEDFSDWDDAIRDSDFLTPNDPFFDEDDDGWLSDNFNVLKYELINEYGLDRKKPLAIILDNGRLDVTKTIDEISFNDFIIMAVKSWSKSRENKGEGGPNILRSCIFQGPDDFETDKLKAPEGYSATTDLRAYLMPDWQTPDNDPLNYNVFIFQK